MKTREGWQSRPWDHMHQQLFTSNATTHSASKDLKQRFSNWSTLKKDAVTYTSEALQFATQNSTTSLHNNINVNVGDSYLSRNSSVLVRCNAQACVEVNVILTISSGNSSYGESCTDRVKFKQQYHSRRSMLSGHSHIHRVADQYRICEGERERLDI